MMKLGIIKLVIKLVMKLEMAKLVMIKLGMRMVKLQRFVRRNDRPTCLTPDARDSTVLRRF